jgi:hypothetical protein
MTIECAIKELKEDIDLYIPLHGTIDDVDRELPDGRLITALEMAIASLEAWQKVRQDIQTETDDKSNNMYFNLGMLGALAIINKHLQEVVSPTGAESEE